MRKRIKNFSSIAKLIKEKRVKAGISQSVLSHELGYKQGQFISNVERAQCSIPESKIKKAAKVLKIDPDLIITAMVDDYIQDLKDAVA